MNQDDDVRVALARIAGRVPPGTRTEGPDLVRIVQHRARRIARRRTATRGALAVASVVAVIAGVSGVSGLISPDPGHDQNSPAATISGPAVPSRPARTPSANTTRSAAGSATPDRQRTGDAPATSASSASASWGAPSWQDVFSGSRLDRSRWTLRYDDGVNTPFSSWSAADVSVAGGALRLSVSRAGNSSPAATSGGIGAAASAASTGRWEVRWRMTSGQGVIGQFALVAASSTGSSAAPRYLATLQPGEQEVKLEDTAAGRSVTVPLGTSGWHTVAIELAPHSVRWLVDGTVTAHWTSRPKAEPVWPALQTLLPGPDCGANPLPADCAGHRTPFPQALEADRFRFWAG